MILLPRDRRIRKFQAGGRAMAVQGYDNVAKAGSQPIPFDNKMEGWKDVYMQPYDLGVNVSQGGYRTPTRGNTSKDEDGPDRNGFYSDDSYVDGIYYEAYNALMKGFTDDPEGYAGTPEQVKYQTQMSRAIDMYEKNKNIRLDNTARLERENYDRSAYLTVDGEGKDAMFVKDNETGKNEFVPWYDVFTKTIKGKDGTEYRKYIPLNLANAQHVRQSDPEWSFYNKGQALDQAITNSIDTERVDDVIETAFAAVGIVEVNEGFVSVRDEEGNITTIPVRKYLDEGHQTEIVANYQDSYESNKFNITQAILELDNRITSNPGLHNSYKNYAVTQLYIQGEDVTDLSEEDFYKKIGKVITDDIRNRAQKYIIDRAGDDFKTETPGGAGAPNADNTVMTNFDLDINKGLEWKPVAGILSGERLDRKIEGAEEYVLSSPRAQINSAHFLLQENMEPGNPYTPANNGWLTGMVQGSIKKNLVLQSGVPVYSMSEGDNHPIIDHGDPIYYHYGVPSLVYPDGAIVVSEDYIAVEAIFRQKYTERYEAIVKQYKQKLAYEELGNPATVTKEELDAAIPPNVTISPQDQLKFAQQARDEASNAVAVTDQYNELWNQIEHNGAELRMMEWISMTLVYEDDLKNLWWSDGDTDVDVWLGNDNVKQINYTSEMQRASMTKEEYEALGGLNPTGIDHHYQFRALLPVDPIRDKLHIIKGITELPVKDRQMKQYLTAIQNLYDDTWESFPIEGILHNRFDKFPNTAK